MSKRRHIGDEEVRFSRQWWLSTTRNLVWLAVVTGLIWIYADTQFTGSEAFRATLHLTTKNNPNVSLNVNGEAISRPIDFRLRGHRSKIVEFQRWFNEHGAQLTYDVTEGHAPGEAPIVETTASIIRKAADLKRWGLDVEFTDPKAVTFRLERVVRIKDVRVLPKTSGAVLTEDPVVSPPTVDILVEEAQWKRVLTELAPEDVVLLTREIKLQGVSTDSPISVPLIRKITLPSGESVVVQPAQKTVRVTVKVQQATASATFSIAPRTQQPVTWATDDTWKEFLLVRKPNEEWTRRIEVEGPATLVQSLQEKDIDAYVVLSEDDKKPTDTYPQRKVVVRLPSPQLKLVGEPPTVSFRLDRRKPASGGP